MLRPFTRILRKTHPSDPPAATRGGFQRLGDFVVCRPRVVIGLWAVLAAVLSLTLPPLTQMVRERPVNILPASAP
jgi:RND superfamily putative drug exporter